MRPPPDEPGDEELGEGEDSELEIGWAETAKLRHTVATEISQLVVIFGTGATQSPMVYLIGQRKSRK